MATGADPGLDPVGYGVAMTPRPPKYRVRIWPKGRWAWLDRITWPLVDELRPSLDEALTVARDFLDQHMPTGALVRMDIHKM